MSETGRGPAVGPATAGTDPDPAAKPILEWTRADWAAWIAGAQPTPGSATPDVPAEAEVETPPAEAEVETPPAEAEVETPPAEMGPAITRPPAAVETEPSVTAREDEAGTEVEQEPPLLVWAPSPSGRWGNGSATLDESPAAATPPAAPLARAGRPDRPAPAHRAQRLRRPRPGAHTAHEQPARLVAAVRLLAVSVMVGVMLAALVTVGVSVTALVLRRAVG